MNTSRLASLTKFLTAAACAATILARTDLHANPGYKARSGKIVFTVGSNVPLLKITGSSAAVTGGGEGAVEGALAVISNLRFEVDPATFKTGMTLRDQHMREKVFTAADGSIPKVVLRADRAVAQLNPQTSQWEGELKGQLTIRGVTRPVTFSASAEQKGAGAVVTAHGSVRTTDFGVKPISYSGAGVYDEVTVTVSNLVVEP